MKNFLKIFLTFIFCFNAFAELLPQVQIDQKIQKILAEKYDVSKEDFLRYTKNLHSQDLYLYVLLAQEANIALEDFVKLAKNFKKPIASKKSSEIEFGANSILAIIVSKESGHTFEEIIKMSDGGDIKSLESLIKKLDIKSDRIEKGINEITHKFSLIPHL